MSGMDIVNFTFDKPWYRQTELLDKLCMSATCLKRYMAEQVKGGGNLTQMGYLKFKGFKEICWDPIKFVAWLIEYKLELEPKYDYELAEQKRVQMGIINFNKQQQKRKTI